jgi:hypothetical protein
MTVATNYALSASTSERFHRFRFGEAPEAGAET